ncbi:MAG: hypothetical protein R3304_02515 [Longimicrobiales bacterium]|nr:hypothetical protein [Longimicrobiales bacterium]
MEPPWSPDGSLIAFQSDRDGDREIYVVAPDGSGLRDVTNAPAYDDRHPTWEPN